MRERSNRKTANRRGILAKALRRNLRAEPLESRIFLASQPLDTALTNYFSTSSDISSDLSSALSSVNTEVIAPLNGLNIPLIGTQLQSASNFVADLSTKVQSALSSIQSTSPQSVADAINSEFPTNSGNVRAASTLVPVYYMGGDANTPGTTPAGPSDTATNVLYNLDLKGSYTYSTPLSFNLGLPAISLVATNVNPTVSITYNFYLHFGVDDQGLYFDTNPSDSTFVNSTDPVDPNVPAGNTKAITFVANVGLEAAGSTTPATFKGTFGGLLQLNAQDMLSTGSNPKFLFNQQTAPDNPGTTGFAAQFGVQFTNGGPSGGLAQLTGNGISNLVPTVSLGGTAKVDLFMDLSFGDPNYPSVDAEFELAWKFGDGNGNPQSIPGGDGADAMNQPPTLEFNNVELNIGSFLGGFAKNIISDVGSILEPIAPLITVLNDPAPIFNDIGFLRNLVDDSSAGNMDGTATIGEVLGYLLGDDSIGNFADGAADVLSVYNELSNFTASGNNTYLKFGSFSLNASGFDLRNSTNSLSTLDTSNTSLYSSSISTLSDLENSFTSALSSAGSFADPDAGDISTPLSSSLGMDLFGQGTSSEGTSNGGLTFPILDNPKSLFGLLLGQQVDLFDYTSPVLEVGGVGVDISFPIIPPLAGVIKGTVNGDDVFDAKGQISVGYDTTGLEQFASDHNISDLANGFFINTALNPATGEPSTSLSLQFGIGVGAELDLILVEAGVTGGIDGNVTLSINGGNDNRYYPFANNVTNLVSALTLSGELNADLQAFVKVGIGPFSVEADFTLASIELLNFNSSSQSNAPSIGSVDSNGNLTLGVAYADAPYALSGSDIIHIAHSGGYTNQSTGIKYETITATEKSSAANAQPIVQTFYNVRSITVEGGYGANNIVIEPGVTSQVTAYTNYTPEDYADGAAPGPYNHYDGNSSIVDEGTGPYALYGGEPFGNGELADTITATGGDFNAPSAGGTIYPGSKDNVITVDGMTNTYSGPVVVQGLGENNNINIGPGIYSANITGGSGSNVLDSSAYFSTITATTSPATSASDDFIVHAGITDPTSAFDDPQSAGASYTLYPNGLSNVLEIVGANAGNNYTIAANPLSAAPGNITVTDNYTLPFGATTTAITETFNTDGYSGAAGTKGFQYLDVEGGASFNASSTQAMQTFDTYHIGDLSATDVLGVYANVLRSKTGGTAYSNIYVTASSSDTDVIITGAQSTFTTSSTSVAGGAVYSIGGGEGPAIDVADGAGDGLTVFEPSGNIRTDVSDQYDAGDIGVIGGTSGTNDVYVGAGIGPVQFITNGCTADVSVETVGASEPVTVETVVFQGSHEIPDGSATINVDGGPASSSPILSTLTDGSLTLNNTDKIQWIGPLTSLSYDLNAAGDTLTDSMAASDFPVYLYTDTVGNYTVNASTASCPINFDGTNGYNFSNGTYASYTINGSGRGDYIKVDVGPLSVNEVNSSANGPWDTILGGSSNDYILAYGGNESINGGAGNDTIIYGVFGSSQLSPTLIGGEGSDTIIAYGGTPLIYTDTTAGSINGQDGNDTVEGTNANATIYGGAGTDTYELGAYSTTLPGTNFPDPNSFGPSSIYFGTGTAYLYAGPAADTVYGGNSHDYLEGFSALATAPTPLVIASGNLTDDISSGVAGTAATNADIVVNSGATFTLSDQSQTIGSLAGAGSVYLNGYSLATGADNTSTTFTGVISGTGSVSKVGTGTWTLGGVNTYSGATNINAGTLLTTVNNAMPASTDVTVAAGATFSIYFGGETIGSLAGGGLVIIGAGQLTTGGDNLSTTFSGTITGYGNLTKAGTGIWILSGSSNYTGITTINGGTLQTGVSNATPATSDWTIGSNGTLNIGSDSETVASLSGSGTVLMNGGALTTGGDNNSTSYSGIIAGTGSLIKVGSGTFQCATPSFSGSSNVQAGIFRTLSNTASLNYLPTCNKSNNIYTTLNEQFPHSGTGTPGSGAGTPNASFLFDPSPSAVAAAGYAPSYVANSNLVNNGVKFNLASDAVGHDYAEIASGVTLNVAANLPNVSTVYALMSAYNGQTVNVTFTTAGGTTQVFNNVSLPDFSGGTINSTGGNPVDQTVFQVYDVGGGGTGNSVTGATNNYDLTEVGFTLNSSFASQQLASVSFKSNGNTCVLFGLTAVQQNVMPSAVTVASGAAFDVNNLTLSIGSLAGAGSVTLGTGALTTGADNTNTAFSGVISNGGSVAKSGSGTWTVSGANTYTGSFSDNGGTVNFNSLSALGMGNAINFSGGTLQYAAGNTIDISTRTVTINTGGGTIDTNGTNVTFANAIGNNGVGSFGKAGTGILTLNSVGTWQGATAITGGTLLAAITNVLPTATDLTITTTGKFDLGNLNQSIGSLAGDSTGLVALGAATLTSGAGGNTNSTTFAGSINGTGKVIKMGGSVLTLSGSNTYSGGTQINEEASPGSGVNGISISADANLGVASGNLLFTSANGALFVTGTFATIRLIQLFADNVAMTDYINVSGTNVFTASGVISNNSATTRQPNLVKAGTGALTLSAVNTFGAADGTTDLTLLAGTVTLGVANAIPNRTIAFSSGYPTTAKLDLSGFNETLGGINGGFSGGIQLGTITNSGVMATLTIDGNGSTNEYDGSITGPIALVLSNAGENLGGPTTGLRPTASNYSGGTTILSGSMWGAFQSTPSNAAAVTGPFGTGPITLGATSGSGSATLELYGGATEFNPIVIVAGNTGTDTLTSFGLNGNTFGGLITLYHSATIGGAIFSGGIGGNGNVILSDSAGSSPGQNQPTSLPTANTYAGSTTILPSSAVIIGTNNALPAGTALTLNVGVPASNLNLNNFNQTIGSLAEAVGGDATHGALNLGTGTLTLGGDNTSTTFYGVIAGTGAIFKVGSGTLTLGGTDSSTGPLNISGGAVVIGDGTTYGSWAGNIVLGNAAVGFNLSSNLTYSGTITGTGTLNQLGTGILTIPVPSFTGSTNIQSGTLRVTTPLAVMASAVNVGFGSTFDINSLNLTINSLAGSGAITLGTGTLSTGLDNTSTTFAGIISGSGGLTKLGTGTLTLTNASTYTGSTNVTAGAITLATPTLATLPSPGVLYTFNDSQDSGTTVTNDGTLANKNATLSNATEVSGIAGAPGGGKVFAMNNSTGELLVNLTSNKGVDFSGGSWTAGLWFDGLFSSSNYRTPFSSNSTNDAQALVASGGSALGSYVNGFVGSSYNVDGSGSPPINVTSGWHQLVAVGSGGTTRFYIDGGLAGSVNLESTGDLYAIGNYAHNLAEPFASYLADISVYQIALTPAQIAELYLTQKGPLLGGSLASNNVTVAPGASLNVDANAGLSASTALTSNGTTTFAASTTSGILTRTLGSVTIGSAGSVLVAAAANHTARTEFITGGLSFAGSASTGWQGKLDLANNDLDVSGGSLANISSQLAQGDGNGNWSGTGGIVSSSATADPTHLTALGGIQNSVDGTASGAPLYGTGTTLGLFDGNNPANSDVLVKYTYVGDTNLDGVVDGSDYTKIDNGFHNAVSGWFNGDFNYDTVIDGSDYTLIDNAFNTQASPLSLTESRTKSQALSSPATVSSIESTSATVVRPESLTAIGEHRSRPSIARCFATTFQSTTTIAFAVLIVDSVEQRLDSVEQRLARKELTDSFPWMDGG